MMERRNFLFQIDCPLDTESSAFRASSPRGIETETSRFRSRETQITVRATETCAVELFDPLSVGFVTDDAGAIAFPARQFDRFAKSRCDAILQHDAINNRFNRVRFFGIKCLHFGNVHHVTVDSCADKAIAGDSFQDFPMSATSASNHGGQNHQTSAFRQQQRAEQNLVN